MAFDFKKEFKELYMPKKGPAIIDVPEMKFVTIEGVGNPNEENGAYQKALNILYSISYTIRMSEKAGHEIDGYFPYVVPPLEGLWWMADGSPGLGDKDGLAWVSMIRLPDFVTQEVFDWACATAARKKNINTDQASLLSFQEGLCVQCMHIGSYDDEPATVELMDRFMEESGFYPDFSTGRRHHEIYLSDPRKVEVDKRKTIIRHPIKK